VLTTCCAWYRVGLVFMQVILRWVDLHNPMHLLWTFIIIGFPGRLRLFMLLLLRPALLLLLLLLVLLLLLFVVLLLLILGWW
jgi:hypothetical protein